jgi:hypothetical protein
MEEQKVRNKEYISECYLVHMSLFQVSRLNIKCMCVLFFICFSKNHVQWHLVMIPASHTAAMKFQLCTRKESIHKTKVFLQYSDSLYKLHSPTFTFHRQLQTTHLWTVKACCFRTSLCLLLQADSWHSKNHFIMYYRYEKLVCMSGEGHFHQRRLD